MAEIVLRHKMLGEISRLDFYYPVHAKRLIKKWKYLYGKKFNECEVVIQDYFIKKIKHIPTNNIFTSIRKASKGTNSSESKIEGHLYSNRNEGFIYEFEYIYEPVTVLK